MRDEGSLPQSGSQQTPLAQNEKLRCEASIPTDTGPCLAIASLNALRSPEVTLTQDFMKAVEFSPFI